METHNDSKLYWSLLIYEDWTLHLAATLSGLCFVGAQQGTMDELKQWADARLPDWQLVRDDAKLAPYASQLIEYLRGERTAFTLPFDQRGTSFQQAVWQALAGIPYGETKSYSDIAALIGRPAASRAVGAAIGANPILIPVPCHRVIGKGGALTGYRGGMDMKTRLLELEQAAAARGVRHV
ncbi:methylated-DNA-[protein]-cysteine S-methyltransferase [Paenibacillus sp. UNCCL117]|uniref:methylated-DNA--[protein]-cysteine S-methyltransferase n=1 Tax=unclassified Paenibacillus TaxID=185978 RepID=UPI0008906CF9|nr:MULTISPECIES: methylated-DNA--[protein]-cysteine S-methyltransferase [unclassified Paenibacillus]SDD56725.1 methylated-DNA-[protein]-cysteine S-methyltransferase [Paenibacillus sp. cl123]SFW51330.1 methylated-DNA-[protein]-cysteine S-methyltransferase [Paenibacillus sp. UNCCL117]